MYIHEYQAKELLKANGITVPPGGVATSEAEARSIAEDLGGDAWVVKAQVHAGARGKAGGIRLTRSLAEVGRAAAALLGKTLVTEQTGAGGLKVERVYVEQACDIERELYLTLFVDRSAGRVAVVASALGGGDVEQRLSASLEEPLKLLVDPDEGPDAEKVADIAMKLKLTPDQGRQAADIVDALYRSFVAFDADLIELNPLAVTRAGQLVAIDVKMSFDDNALFRHPDIEALRDQSEVDPLEIEAKRSELNYVKLAGKIGCMVNGAGLALATHDILKQLGGEPADFMDVRPVATREQVAFGFKMLLANPQVKAILVNIYGGGILRCDTIAEGIASAVKEKGLKVPLVVRAAGTNKEICRKVLSGQGVRCTFENDIAAAAVSVIAASNREAA